MPGPGIGARARIGGWQAIGKATGWHLAVTGTTAIGAHQSVWKRLEEWRNKVVVLAKLSRLSFRPC